jgi:uncharacterized damage-inducible protein DinB
MKTAILTAAIVVCLPALASEEVKTPPPAGNEKMSAAKQDPLSAYNKAFYEGVKAMILRSAEKMPEENYNFKPTEAVRSFGQIIGHVADAQYIFGALVLGQKNPTPKIEQTKTSKADLIAALKVAFAYCDKAYDGMTDASARDLVKFFRSDTPKVGVLTANLLHTMGHYGNLATYMRMKNIIPPSSEPGFLPEAKK